MQRWRATFVGGLFLGMALATMSLGCGAEDTGQKIELPAGTQTLTPAPEPAGGASADPNQSQGVN